MEDLKGNVIKSETSQTSKVTQTVSGGVILRKDSEPKNPVRRFFVEDGKTVLAHIFDNVIIPKIKQLISESFKTGVDDFLYGKNNASRFTNNSGVVSYGSIYNRSGYVSVPTSSYATQANPMMPQKQTSLFRVNDYLYAERGKAEAALTELQDILNRYGSVSVADYYETIDVTSENRDPMNQKWGWYSLDEACVIDAENGMYAIRFPKLQRIVQG